ncbi:MAG: GNAT family N-acetyltransferase [Acidobacteriota bacterium]|nr:GNAT family N-acetyltransferase [Acidobacteriota bacterium]
MIEIKALRKTDWKRFGAKLQKLESVAEYPYGSDFFTLNHGSDYFAFFERMGEPLFHTALDDDRVIACAAGILRTLKIENKTVRAWYLCDLKIHPEFRGRHITAKLFRLNLFCNYFKCPRGYAISMNPASGENRVVKLLKRLPQIPIGYAGQLNFYSFNQDEAASVQKDLETELGKLSYLSLKGKKDLIMKSTNSPLPLYHIQHGAMAAEGAKSPTEEGTYMICAFENSSLDTLLKNRFPISATASILAHRMKPKDWNFILTSDI